MGRPGPSLKSRKQRAILLLLSLRNFDIYGRRDSESTESSENTLHEDSLSTLFCRRSQRDSIWLFVVFFVAFLIMVFV